MKFGLESTRYITIGEQTPRDTQFKQDLLSFCQILVVVGMSQFNSIRLFHLPMIPALLFAI